MQDTVFKAIADPQRRKILQLLQAGSRTAGQIATEFAITKGSLSYHFNILKEADLIRSERRGQEQVYSLNTSVLEDLAVLVLDLVRPPVSRRKSV
jgi:ArsR family transcriptional regulator, arsenate/arsenite/antimonite-responsive transcriptional repressor